MEKQDCFTYYNCVSGNCPLVIEEENMVYELQLVKNIVEMIVFVVVIIVTFTVVIFVMNVYIKRS